MSGLTKENACTCKRKLIKKTGKHESSCRWLLWNQNRNRERTLEFISRNQNLNPSNNGN